MKPTPRREAAPHREPTHREIIARDDRKQLLALVEFNKWRNAEPSRVNNPYAPEYRP